MAGDSMLAKAIQKLSAASVDEKHGTPRARI